MNGFDFIGYNRQLVNDLGARLHAVDNERQLQVMAELIDQVEQTLAQNLTPIDHEMLACKAGCGCCCMVNVAVLDPEVLNIAEYLRCGSTPEELATLKRRMGDLVTAISDLDEEERIALRKSCVFLDEDNNCSIYPVRPLLCRSITSIDADDCRDALTMQALGECVPVTMNLFQKNLFDVTYQALATALADAGLEDRSHELTAAVLKCLEEE